MDGAARNYVAVVLAPTQLTVAQRGRASHDVDKRGLLMLGVIVPIVRYRFSIRICWMRFLEEVVAAAIHAVQHKFV